MILAIDELNGCLFILSLNDSKSINLFKDTGIHS